MENKNRDFETTTQLSLGGIVHREQLWVLLIKYPDSEELLEIGVPSSYYTLSIVVKGMLKNKGIIRSETSDKIYWYPAVDKWTNSNQFWKLYVPENQSEEYYIRSTFLNNNKEINEKIAEHIINTKRYHEIVALPIQFKANIDKEIN